jgi:DNA-binding transcriptional regulator/RsmH inhibitor MraZ
MRAEDVRELLNREPFVPLKLVKTDGKTLPIKFRRALVAMKTFVIVFKGIESATSSFAKKGFEEFPYENIARLEPAKSQKRANGKKNGRGHK